MCYFKGFLIRIWISQEIFGKYPTQNFSKTVRGESNVPCGQHEANSRLSELACKGHKIYLKETGWEGMDWIKLAQNSDQEQNSVKTVKNRDVRRASATSWLATAVSAAENEDEGVTKGRSQGSNSTHQSIFLAENSHGRSLSHCKGCRPPSASFPNSRNRL
jgi:hypothetical protein